ncbi:hypothetical protein P376_0383 [Streptomyces sp. HCCB10043]|uniref:Predicted protein n=1 Tax=Streptomyces filamentosus NRRL 15998 TaxID=457431 RepID=D6AJN4_STRFL|nr:predicted protein [Streptomyces filamentosus NRRL 15998]ESU51641.1 hypothetical protein P376_0383 [Streptomyces sp. HCCB10043]EWS94253.1 hypothetical protein SSIG_04890 [Streptomyces filamentosus NRRL 11379]
MVSPLLASARPPAWRAPLTVPCCEPSSACGQAATREGRRRSDPVIAPPAVPAPSLRWGMVDTAATPAVLVNSSDSMGRGTSEHAQSGPVRCRGAASTAVPVRRPSGARPSEGGPPSTH